MNPYQGNDPVSLHSEETLIDKIRIGLGAANPPPPAGIGDDCSVLPVHEPGLLLITTDPVIHGRHFDDTVSPEVVGAKLLKRNLSDIAAMGGKPLAGLLGLFLPPETSLRWLEGLIAGLRDSAIAWDMTITGGDIARTDGFLGASLTLFGKNVHQRILARTGGCAGDFLYVTGALGGSLAGKHWSFEPRVAEGIWLAARPDIHSMIDLSDGLAKDLPALVPESLTAVLDPDAVPLAPAAAGLRAAFCDGEDYELLFTCAGDAAEELESAWPRSFTTPLARIGRFLPRAEQRGGEAVVFSDGTHLPDEWRGYEHFPKA